MRISGHAGLLATGLPAPFQAVDWKPSSTLLAAVSGWRVGASTLLRVAQSLAVTPGGIVRLPIAPTLTYSRTAAIRIARHLTGLGGDVAVAAAKLSSWTEVQSLMQSAAANGRPITGPIWLAQAPWRPLWVALLHGDPLSRGERQTLAVVVDAGSGTPWQTNAPVDPSTWFALLTDRDPRIPGCPGGSTTRLPFGVLTRNEEAYTVRGLANVGPDGARNTVIIKLTTYPKLTKGGLCGGPDEPCSLPDLVWPTITVTRAAPGKTIQCPPTSVSVPPSFRYRHVRVEFGISDPGSLGSSESGCGALPRWIVKLRDLAPASNVA